MLRKVQISRFIVGRALPAMITVPKSFWWHRHLAGAVPRLEAWATKSGGQCPPYTSGKVLENLVAQASRLCMIKALRAHPTQLWLEKFL
jgi:hypothetical protein